VIFERTDIESAADVIFRLGPVDDVFGSHAITDLGPPRGRPLELRFDEAENWNPQLFSHVACHEIGHLLGLTHSPTKGELMYAAIQRDVLAPTKEDIRRAQEIWGAPERATANLR
jgi:hypothetical protein